MATEVLTEAGRLLLATAAAAWVAGAFALCAWRVVVHLIPTAPCALRAVAMSVTWLWLATSAFWILASVGLFVQAAALAVATATAIASTFVGARDDRHRTFDGQLASLSTIVRSAHQAWRGLGWVRLLVVGTSAPVVLRVVRGLIAPPLAWDSLTYHLPLAARVVQTGALDFGRAPDAWGYYSFFPLGGELLWAWTMLFPRGDAYIAAVGGGVWAATLLATYAALRALGSDSRRAMMWACVVAATPALASFVSSAYVDPIVWWLFAAGTALFVHGLRSRAAAALGLSLAAFGLATGVKLTIAPVLAVATIASGFALVTRPGGVSRAPWAVGAAALALAPGMASIVRSWVLTGSPTYPWAVDALGWHGHEQLAGLLRGDWLERPSRPWTDIVLKLFVQSDFAGVPHLNFGLPLAVVIAAAVPAALRSVRKPRCRLLLLLAASVVAVNVAPFTGAASWGVRTMWWAVVGRFLGPTYLSLVFVAAGGPVGRGRRVVAGLCCAAVFAGIVQAWPLGFGKIGWLQVGVGALLAAVAFTMLWLAWRVRSRSRVALVGFSVFGLCLGPAALGPLRTIFRYPTYEAAATGTVFDLHPLTRGSAKTWPIWAHIDEHVGHRIAVSAAWDGVGHNWFWYPLLGSQLQNDVRYVPISGDGTIVDYQDVQQVSTVAAEQAWLERLQTYGVQYLVLLTPLPPAETTWVRAHPRRFEYVALPPGTTGGLLRVRTPPRVGPP